MTRIEGAVLLAQVQSWLQLTTATYIDVAYTRGQCELLDRYRLAPTLEAALFTWVRGQADSARAQCYRDLGIQAVPFDILGTVWRFELDEPPSCRHTIEGLTPRSQPTLKYVDDSAV